MQMVYSVLEASTVEHPYKWAVSKLTIEESIHKFSFLFLTHVMSNSSKSAYFFTSFVAYLVYMFLEV